MNQTPNFELFYDVLDESLLALYEIKHDRFFNLLLRTGRNIVAGEVLDKEATPEQKDNLVKIYEKLDGIDFNVEEIRKAFQMMILRGFKEEKKKKIAHWIRLIVDDFEANKETVSKEVTELCEKFPIY